MANLTSVDITNGIPSAGTGTVATINALQADGGLVTLGAKADAKSTATDTTAITAMQVLKQISASAQLSATVAKQPALGTAGTASADVISVQGIASAVPIPTVGPISYITVTLTLDTSPYASGDLLADSQAIAAALRVTNGYAILHSVHAIDEDDQGVAFDIYILDSNVSMGTENSAPSITDANGRTILGPPIAIAVADWKDLGGCRIAGRDGINKVCQGADATTSLYVAVVNGTGTPTYTASGVRLRFGFLQG